MKTTIDWFLEYAWSFLGTPYKWAGDDPIEGIDCSGLVIECLRAVGKYPHKQDSTANGLFENFAWLEKHVTSAEAGCLVFFGKPSAVTHVAICLSHEVMIEAGGGGSTTLTEEIAAKQNAFVKMSPIKRRSDIVGFINPFKE